MEIEALEHSEIQEEDDRIAVTQEIIDSLLVFLGDTLAENAELQRSVQALRSQALKFESQVASVPPQPIAVKESVPASGVLIVDDSRVMQLRLKATINSLGHKVVGVADNGLFGADLAVSLNPKLIILDHSMPEMGGVECARLIRASRPDCALIILSATLTEEASRQYAMLGIRDILTKPVHLDQFVMAIDRFMNSTKDGGVASK